MYSNSLIYFLLSVNNKPSFVGGWVGNKPLSLWFISRENILAIQLFPKTKQNKTKQITKNIVLKDFTFMQLTVMGKVNIPKNLENLKIKKLLVLTPIFYSLLRNVSLAHVYITLTKSSAEKGWRWKIVTWYYCLVRINNPDKKVKMFSSVVTHLNFEIFIDKTSSKVLQNNNYFKKDYKNIMSNLLYMLKDCY